MSIERNIKADRYSLTPETCSFVLSVKPFPPSVFLYLANIWQRLILTPGAEGGAVLKICVIMWQCLSLKASPCSTGTRAHGDTATRPHGHTGTQHRIGRTVLAKATRILSAAGICLGTQVLKKDDKKKKKTNLEFVHSRYSSSWINSCTVEKYQKFSSC